MAQIVKLRRSSVSGQKPTNTNLQLGELALNTTDGKVFMAVSGSGGPSVEELIVTNTVNTGSINVSGSIHLIGKETISGSLYIASSSLPEIRLTNIDHNQSYHITVGNYGYLNLHDGLGNNVAAFGTSSAGLIGDLYVSHSVTASEFTGSFVGNASGLYNVPLHVSGADINENNYNKTFSKLQFDDSTGLNVSESAPGVAFISIDANIGQTTEGRTARLDQIVANTTWTFNHNLGEQYPTVTIYDENDNVVIPQSIFANGANTMIITFPSAQSGHAVATIGGGLPYLSGSYDGYVLAGVSNTPTWKGGIVSGSLQVSNLGFASTGSNTFIGDQVIEGSIQLRDSEIKHFIITGLTVGSHTVTTLSNGLYSAGFFDYVVKNGSNMRAGTVTAVWDGMTIKFNEVSTNDIGDTSPVILSAVLASGNVNLNATISSGTWDFRTLVRGI